MVMTTLFYLTMTLFIIFFVYTVTSQVRMIIAALHSEKVQKEFQKEKEGFAVVRSSTAA